MTEDTWSALIATENVLREVIERILGDTWMDSSGLSASSVSGMRERYEKEQRTRDGGKVEQRLLYYAYLGDLRKIISADWPRFEDCFGDRDGTLHNLDRLADYRNPEAHGRDLLPFEEHLVLGLTGELRNKVTIYLSEQSQERQYFPRIESAVDSFGNSGTPMDEHNLYCDTGLILHPGDEMTFRLSASDPEAIPWTWQCSVSGQHAGEGFMIDGDEVTWHVTDVNIGDPTELQIVLVSDRAYHRRGGPNGFDAAAFFRYRVHPREDKPAGEV